LSKIQDPDLRYQKFVGNCATSAINQLAVAALMQSGRYDRHLRTMRMQVAQAVSRMIDRIGRYFPTTIKITQPQGGYVIWLELPKKIDANAIAEQALEHGISVAPGSLFSTSQKYRHCMRLNCAVAWTDQTEHALIRLGTMIAQAL